MPDGSMSVQGTTRPRSAVDLLSPIAPQSTSEPLSFLRGAYGCYVIGDTMSPAYEQGDMLLVRPGRPVRTGDDVLISRVLDDGSRQAIIRRLVGITAKGWRVRRFNPPCTLTLDRKEWPTVELVIGMYSR